LMRCYSGAAFLVGIRAAGESPNRWRAVVKNPVNVAGKHVYWGTKKGANVALYPLYDWNFHDIWRYIADEKLRYSKVYDWQFRKGYPISQMRVSSLIHERAFKSIVDLPEFEPKTYDRLQKRIKGIALAQETGKASKLFACRKLPKNFTSWIAYRDFLLKTHPDPQRVHIFAQRFARQLVNEYVARQQCRQLVLNDYENNLPIDSKPDPRDELIAYYERVL
jgi:predicted phosphoadenosine phosphosulfate sulfurtransferase